jgi:hypothetical protein
MKSRRKCKEIYYITGYILSRKCDLLQRQNISLFLAIYRRMLLDKVYVKLQ